MNDASRSTSDEQEKPSRVARFAYLGRDGTLDIVVGGLIASVGNYAYQFIAGRSLGEEAFAPIGILLTVHFLAFLIVLVPIEQFVIRRLTLGAQGWVIPLRVFGLVGVTAVAAAVTVFVSGDEYFRFTDRQTLALFAVGTVGTHFLYEVGRGYFAGFRRFRSYGRVSASASLVRLGIAVGVALTAQSITGFAWAHVLGPLVILAWRPWRMLRRRDATPDQTAAIDPRDDKWLLSGLVMSAAASQALLLATPLVASRLGASDIQFSVIYATLLLARAPLTIGYSLIARILPSFTAMAASGQGHELRVWARTIGLVSLALAVVGALAGGLVGPTIVSITLGAGFAPTSTVAAMAGASAALAAGGLFIGQVLVAKSQPLRLAMAWLAALGAAALMLGVSIDDPVVHAMLALVVGELVALIGVLIAAVMFDRDDVSASLGD